MFAFKWVLARAGLLPIVGQQPANDVYNKATVDAVKKLQKKAGITPINGYCGPTTFEASKLLKKKGSKTELAWDAYREKLYNDAVADMQIPTEDDVREFIAQQLYITYKFRDDISYTQFRPVYAVVNKVRNPALAKRIDCSGEAIYGGALATWHFKKYGINVPPYDPTYKLSGYGNTWSLKKGGHRIVRSQARVGDLVFYTGHVAIVVNRQGDNVNVVSMGSESGPHYLPDEYRRDIEEYRTYDLHEVI